jgi:ABC-type transport system substrate-binding protein
MTDAGTQRRRERIGHSHAAIALIAMLVVSGACRSRAVTRTDGPSSAVLRVGIGPLSSTSSQGGLRQFSQLLYTEGLARLGVDGRPQPWLAEKWDLADEGRSLIVTLRNGVTFHDGSPVTAEIVAGLLPDALRSTTMGNVFEDVERIRATSPTTIEIRLRHASPFLLEGLEVPVRKPGSPTVGTGPFKMTSASMTEFEANANYYLGRPQISQIRLGMFPSVRGAWAELLRNGIDMLHEVGPDALDSLQSSTNIAVFTYIRHYQYLVVLNSALPALKSPAIRRALNLAIDRPRLIKDALSDHGVPSNSVIWPQYWALEHRSTVDYDPQHAAQVLSLKHLRLTCLVPPDLKYERIALELKRQLAAVGVDLVVLPASHDQIFEAEKERKYEAVLTEAISAPSLLRPYQLWHSGGAGHQGGFGSPVIDAAYDRVRFAGNETDYRMSVAALQQTFTDDPPAIFLAWGEHARAVSKRFEVPAQAPGRDALGSLRLWVPRTEERVASRN